ncbi:MAG: hypothetical protein KF703_12900 [Actinobacteria bacterium]|nr:hypothetical protein [Actinomycetota bacterium]
MSAPGATSTEIAGPAGSPSSASTSPPTGPGFGPFSPAALASIGAGAVHLAAIGPHADVPQAAATFAALGLAQLAWGAAALPARRRAVGAVGLVLHGAALVGWVLAKTAGIAWIDGLSSPEALQLADLIAAVLAAVAGALTARVLLAGRTAAVPGRRLALPAAAVLVVAVLGAFTTPGHQHDDHDHDEGPVGHAHAVGPLPAVDYDPADVDLSGVPGVTSTERERAERLVRAAVAAAPAWSRVADAEAAGFRLADLDVAGVEQYVRWPALADDHEADPANPEGLVYEVSPSGRRTLVALVLLVGPDVPVSDAPDLGGALAPWRVEDHLCATGSGAERRLTGLAAADGSCPVGQSPAGTLLRQQVWVVPHRCGPFAGLDDVADRLEAPTVEACVGP